MDERVARIRRAMQASRCDNLERAERAFAGQSAEYMNAKYGHSNDTPTQIIDGYRKDREEWQAAWDLLVKVLPEVGY